MPLKLVRSDDGYWLRVIGVKSPVFVNIKLELSGEVAPKVLDEVIASDCPSPGIYSTIIDELSDALFRARASGDNLMLMAKVQNIVDQYGEDIEGD